MKYTKEFSELFAKATFAPLGGVWPADVLTESRTLRTASPSLYTLWFLKEICIVERKWWNVLFSYRLLGISNSIGPPDEMSCWGEKQWNSWLIYLENKYIYLGFKKYYLNIYIPWIIDTLFEEWLCCVCPRYHITFNLLSFTRHFTQRSICTFSIFSLICQTWNLLSFYQAILN